MRDLERGGQFLRAFVVLAPGVEGSEGLEAELRQDATQSLPEHEVPREIEFVDELPTAQGGKVRRLELRERLVVGRPLWEIPTTTELEPEFLEPLPVAARMGRRRRRLDGAGRGGSRLAGTARTGYPTTSSSRSPRPRPEPEPELAPSEDVELEAEAVPVEEPVPEPAARAGAHAEPRSCPWSCPTPSRSSSPRRSPRPSR